MQPGVAKDYVAPGRPAASVWRSAGKFMALNNSLQRDSQVKTDLGERQSAWTELKRSI
jgi:hypothetical protein